MPNLTLSELVAAALAAARGSATSGGAQEKETKQAGEDVAAGKAERRYGVVLKRRNDFNPAAGTTGAATSRVDDPSGSLKIEPKGTCLAVKRPKLAGSLTRKD